MKRPGGGDEDPLARIRGGTLSFEFDGELQSVLISRDGGGFSFVDAQGNKTGAYVEAARTVLGLAAEVTSSGLVKAAAAGGAGDNERISQPDDQSAPVPEDINAALADLATALGRVGLDKAAAAPSVREAFEHVLEDPAFKRSTRLQRWAGRLRRAFDREDHVLMARLLSAAVDDTTAGADGQLRGWPWRVGSAGGPASGRAVQRIVDRQLIEVG